MTQDLSARLRRVEQQVRAFRELHSSELQLILDELTDISKQLDEEKAAETTVVPSVDAAKESGPSDPAASSPKRAKWLAEQERKAAPKSRRELLFRERDEPQRDGKASK